MHAHIAQRVPHATQVPSAPSYSTWHHVSCKCVDDTLSHMCNLYMWDNVSICRKEQMLRVTLLQLCILSTLRCWNLKAASVQSVLQCVSCRWMSLRAWTIAIRPEANLATSKMAPSSQCGAMALILRLSGGTQVCQGPAYMSYLVTGSFAPVMPTPMTQLLFSTH